MFSSIVSLLVKIDISIKYYDNIVYNKRVAYGRSHEG